MPAIIDDQAPTEKKGLWLGLLFACIPIGTALGYFYGPIVSEIFGWPFAFFIEAIPCITFFSIIFLRF